MGCWYLIWLALTLLKDLSSQAPKRHEATAPRLLSSLDALPEEIIERIALYASSRRGASRYIFDDEPYRPKNLISMRLTCRAIEAKTRHAFARIAFRIHSLDFSFEGLLKLRQISKHSEFAPAVRTLYLSSYGINDSITVGFLHTLQRMNKNILMHWPSRKKLERMPKNVAILRCQVLGRLCLLKP